MADFENIIGWQEELDEFKQTEQGQDYFDTIEAVPGKSYKVRKQLPKLPFSYIVELAELYLIHDELKETIDYWVEWGRIEESNLNLEFDDPEYFQSLQPYYRKIKDFQDWYSYKKNIPYNDLALGMGSLIAAKVAGGELQKVLSTETESWVRKKSLANIEIEG